MADAPSASRAGHAPAARERGRYGVPGASSCHCCRQCCDSYKAQCATCAVRWCAPCLRVKLGRDARAVSAAGNWRCPRCEGDCPCSNCRRKAGKAPLGQLARAARAAGCDSVAHYLAGEI